MAIFQGYEISLQLTNVLTIIIKKNGNIWRCILKKYVYITHQCLTNIFTYTKGYNMVLFDNFGNIGMYMTETVDNTIIFKNEIICKKINDSDILREEMEQLRDEIKQLRDEIKQLRDETKQQRDETKQQHDVTTQASYVKIHRR